MWISVTGTPGTGKTTVTKQLTDEFNVVHLTEFIEENDIGVKNDSGVKEVDLDKMKKKFSSQYNKTDSLIVEGHLAHFIETEYCVVFRCNPAILEKRLKERDYPEAKIKENIEAEMIDRVLSEALELQETVHEIDTSDKKVQESVEELKIAIDNKKEKYGSINWLDSF